MNETTAMIIFWLRILNHLLKMLSNGCWAIKLISVYITLKNIIFFVRSANPAKSRTT